MAKLSLSGPVSYWVTIPGLILLLGFIVYIVNSVGNFFVLTGNEAAIVAFLGIILSGLITLLKEEETPTPEPTPMQ